MVAWRNRASQPRSGEKRSKMGAKKVRAYVGVQDCKFDSQAEWKYALWLEKEKRAGRVQSWRHHPHKIELYGLRGFPVCMMEPDFLVRNAAGDDEYHEVKGMATAAWRLKRALFEQQTNPNDGRAMRYVVIDAGHVDPPLLFDDRRKRKAERKKARALKPVKRRGAK